MKYRSLITALPVAALLFVGDARKTESVPIDGGYTPVDTSHFVDLYLRLSMNFPQAFYVVGRGDALERIARSHEMTVDDLLEYNGWIKDRKGLIIHPGERIRLTPSENDIMNKDDHYDLFK